MDREKGKHIFNEIADRLDKKEKLSFKERKKLLENLSTEQLKLLSNLFKKYNNGKTLGNLFNILPKEELMKIKKVFPNEN